MLIVNPRDQKKLVQDIKSASRPTEDIAKSSQDNLSTNQESQPKKTDYRQDAQLSPTEIESNEQYSVLPEEVGYVSKFPSSGHVQAWMYIIFIPIYTNILIHRLNSNSTKGDYSIEATKKILEDYSTYFPALSILMILMVITSIYSKKFYMHYVGAGIAFMGFVGHVYLLYIELGSLFKVWDIKNPSANDAISYVLSSSYLYVLLLSSILFLYSFLYFLLPKYRPTY